MYLETVDDCIAYLNYYLTSFMGVYEELEIPDEYLEDEGLHHAIVRMLVMLEDLHSTAFKDGKPITESDARFAYSYFPYNYRKLQSHIPNLPLLDTLLSWMTLQPNLRGLKILKNGYQYSLF